MDLSKSHLAKVVARLDAVAARRAPGKVPARTTKLTELADIVSYRLGSCASAFVRGAGGYDKIPFSF
jgi:hypothetical protein